MTLPAKLVGYVVAGAIALGIILYVLGRVGAFFDNRSAEITRESKQALAVHPALVRMRAKIEAVERELQTVSLARSRASAALRRALAEGRRTDTVQVLREIAVEDSVAVTSCQQSLTACQARAASAQAEAASLNRKLAAQVTVRDRRCGLFGGVGATGGLKVSAGLSVAVGCRLWP